MRRDEGAGPRASRSARNAAACVRRGVNVNRTGLGLFFMSHRPRRSSSSSPRRPPRSPRRTRTRCVSCSACSAGSRRRGRRRGLRLAVASGSSGAGSSESGALLALRRFAVARAARPRCVTSRISGPGPSAAGTGSFAAGTSAPLAALCREFFAPGRGPGGTFAKERPYERQERLEKPGARPRTGVRWRQAASSQSRARPRAAKRKKNSQTRPNSARSPPSPPHPRPHSAPTSPAPGLPSLKRSRRVGGARAARSRRWRRRGRRGRRASGRGRGCRAGSPRATGRTPRRTPRG